MIKNKMRNILMLITIAILILSCSNKENKNTENKKVVKIYSISETVKRNHEILNVIIDRWAPLSNKLLGRNNGDTIFVNEIVLVPESYTNFNIDTTKNSFSIKPHRFLLSVNSKITAHRDTVIKQIKQATPSEWDSRLIYSTIRIEPTMTIKKASFPGEIHDKNSFLVVSEPIEYSKDEFFVIGLLYTKKILLDNLYIVKKVNNRWKVIDAESAVIKLVLNRGKIVVNKDGSTTQQISSSIFDGYVE